MIGSPCATLLDALSVPACVHRGERLLHANAAFERLSGHPRGALAQMAHGDVAEPGQRAALTAYGNACLAGADQGAMETVLRSAGGTDRFVEITARRVVIDGLPLVVTTCIDLSDIRHVQMSLMTMSQVLHQIVDSDPVATFVIDAEHRVTHWNRACAHLTGWPAAEMIGSRDTWRAFYAEERPMLADLIVRGDAPQAIDALYPQSCRPSELVAQAFEAETFFPMLGTDGRWLSFAAAPLRDAGGRLIGAIETLQDVSTRHLAEDALRQHRIDLERLVDERTQQLGAKHLELEAFLHNASVAILTTADRKVQRHNPKFAEMFGVTGGSAVGMDGGRFFCSEAEYIELGRLAWPKLSAGEPVQHEMPMRRQDGQALWVQIIGYVCDHKDPSAGTWWLVQDRTDVRRAEQELRDNFERIKDTNRQLEEAQNQLLQSEKMASIGQLAAGVAHEINNPVAFVSANLGSLKGYLRGLMRLIDAHEATPHADAETTARLARIEAEIDLDFLRDDLPVLLRESEDGLQRVKKIVQDLKDFSRVDSADLQEADLNAGLDSTLNVVASEVKYRADVVKRYGVLPPVRCLAGQLNQVFMNLIVNAAHAISGDDQAGRGTITLATGHQGAWVWVEVADTGCGMSDEVQRRIFEPFYTTKPVGQGTGLGLSLSFAIVQKHGGRIKLESAPGQGSRFRVWIPLGAVIEGEPPG